MFDVREKPSQVETALLIGAYFDRREMGKAEELLDELDELDGLGTIGELLDCSC